MTERYAGGVRLAEVTRSGFAESFHHGSVAIMDERGELVATAGDAFGPIFPRSSNKPLQTIAMLRSGLPVTDPADLAVITASHWGEPAQVARVRALLATADLTEVDLRCPPDLPLAAEARSAVLRAGGGPAPIFMNCSGKHTGMLLASAAAGWPKASYRDADHPLQLVCRQVVAEFTDAEVTAVGVDGCGAPVFAVPLAGLARAFLRLAQAPAGTAEQAVRDAMREYPELLSGTGADDARLMRGLPGLVSKGGAEGVLVAAHPELGAVAIKIDDGAGRARLPVLAAALRWLGLDDPVLAEWAQTPHLGGGVPVGAVRALPFL